MGVVGVVTAVAVLLLLRLLRLAVVVGLVGVLGWLLRVRHDHIPVVVHLAFGHQEMVGPYRTRTRARARTRTRTRTGRTSPGRPLHRVGMGAGDDADAGRTPEGGAGRCMGG